MSRLSLGTRSRSMFFVVTLFLGLLVATAQSSQAQSYSVLYNFCSQPNCADGALPTGALVQDKNGNLYGTAFEGGTGSCLAYYHGCGTVFELSPTGTYTVLHSFTGSPDGEEPSELVLDKQGNLYGTTTIGGVYNAGTVFEITSSGTETVLYSFTGGVDGGLPSGPLVQDAHSNLYGTTGRGGLQNSCYQGSGCGTVFELSPDGKETTLYSFTGNADGGDPSGALTLDTQGNLYGTTAMWNGQPSPGTVFELTPAGVETQLYSFLGGRDGSGPNGGLVRDANGNFYGTTYHGGLLTCSDGQEEGCGAVFKLAPSGKETVRHRFTGKKDGGNPSASLVQDAQGNLYGTTQFGGDLSCLYGLGCGVIFEIPKKGKEIVLFTFPGGAGWDGPSGALLLDTSGNLYGVAGGGQYGTGILFRLTP